MKECSSQAEAYTTVERPLGCFIRECSSQAKAYATVERPLGCYIKVCEPTG